MLIHRDRFYLTDTFLLTKINLPKHRNCPERSDSLVFAVPAKFYVPGESAGTTVYFAKELP